MTGAPERQSTVTGERVRAITLVAADFVVVMERDNRLVWGEGEDLDDFLRRIDACRLSVGDEKKAVGKALLGLGSRISVMDSLSENDTKDVESLKTALKREFGNSARWYQDSFEKRRRQPEETYGMFLSSLRSLFRGAFPGTELETPVAAALMKSRFLDGINPAVSAQLRLLFPDVTVDKLPDHARRVDEALASTVSQAAAVQQAGEGAAAEGDGISQLRGEVAELSRMVQAIHSSGPPPQPSLAVAAGQFAGGAVTSRRGSGRLRCWSCGAQGHVQGECRRVPRGRGAGPDLRVAEGDGRESRLTCWTCGSPGHMQRECFRAPVGRGRGRPAPVVCWRCNEFGHTQFNCPLNLN